MIFHNTKLINLGETEVSLFLFVLLVVSFSSPRDADNLSLRFENVCISRRGLLFYCTSFWNLHTLSSVIDSTLGLRCGSFGYQYSEIIRSLMSINFCGGSCIEDVTTHLMNHLSLHPTLHTCSSDTILRAIKELTQENISYTSDTGKNYDFNTADTLNTLLLNCMFASDQLKEGEKYDAKPTYKKFSGYRPGVAVIGDLIVGIENSDGNTKVPFHGTFSRHGRA